MNDDLTDIWTTVTPECVLVCVCVCELYILYSGEEE